MKSRTINALALVIPSVIVLPLFAAAAFVIQGRMGQIRLPEIVREMPRSYANGSLHFTARLKHRFPLGGSEAQLLAELREQGFAVNRGLGTGSATLTRFTGSIGDDRWLISWKAHEGKLTYLRGWYSCSCQ